MSDISALTVGLSGLDASQQALDLVGQNIANAGTAGYVDEELELQSAGTGSSTWMQSGGGVQVAGVDRLGDLPLQAQMLDAQSGSQSASTVLSALTDIQNNFPEPAASGALSTALSTYWTDWSQVATDPTDASTRTALLGQGQAVAVQLNQLSASIGEVGTEASQQLTSVVSTINGLASQIAALNGQIVQSSGGGGQPDPGLEDQRDALVSQLSQQIGITVTQQADGAEAVTVGNGNLVSGSVAQALTVDGSGASTTVAWQSDGGAVAASGGTVGGLLNVLTSVVPTNQAGLDSVANSLISSVNQVQSQGVDLDGNPGTPFFSGTSAATIAVAISDPNQIAAASASSTVPTDPADNLDGSNAAAAAALGTASTVTVGSGASAATIAAPDASYANFVADLGTAVSQATTQSSAATTAATTASSTYQDQTGVDTNQELTEMVQDQNAYEAAARYLSTIDQTVQDFLQTVG